MSHYNHKKLYKPIISRSGGQLRREFENTRPSGVKCGKYVNAPTAGTCHENLYLASVQGGKHVTNSKRGKRRVTHTTVDFAFDPVWPRKKFLAALIGRTRISTRKPL